MRALALLLLLIGCASKPAAKVEECVVDSKPCVDWHPTSDHFDEGWRINGNYACDAGNVHCYSDPPPATHHPSLPTPKPDKARKRKPKDGSGTVGSIPLPSNSAFLPPTVLGFKICGPDGQFYCVVPIDWSLSCNRGLEHGAEYDVDRSGCVHAMGYLAISSSIVQPKPPEAVRVHLSCSYTNAISTDDGRIELDCTETELAP